MKFKTLITAVFVLCVFSVAQAQLAMGKWRTHFAFNSVMQVAQSENKIRKQNFCSEWWFVVFGR